MKDQPLILPEHIAIIMDGNSRWARKKLLNVSAGHYAGALTLKKLSRDADKLGLRYLTVYAFSTENQRRAQDEVTGLINLIRRFVREYVEDAHKLNIKMRAIGDLSWFPPDIITMIDELTEITKNKTGLTVTLALNYGGRDEIIRAASKLNGRLPTESDFAALLDTADIPDPELLIRTGGDMRLSNFLLWQTAYTELYFDNTLWPDYNITRLKAAVRDFMKRNRRFGTRS